MHAQRQADRPLFPVESLLLIHFVQQWFFGMKASIGVDADSGLVHNVRSAAGHVNDVIKANSLSLGQEADVFADAGYHGAHKWLNAKEKVQSHVVMRRGLCKLLGNAAPMDTLTEQVECIKASIHAKVEAPVWRCEGVLSRVGQEQGAVAHTFCVGQSVNGAQAFERKPGISTPGAWEMREKCAPKTSQRPVISAPPNYGQRSFVQTILRPSGNDK